MFDFPQRQKFTNQTNLSNNFNFSTINPILVKQNQKYISYNFEISRYWCQFVSGVGLFVNS